VPSPSLAIALEETSAGAFTFAVPVGWQVLLSGDAVDAGTTALAGELRAASQGNPDNPILGEMASRVEEIEPFSNAAVAIDRSPMVGLSALVIGMADSPGVTVAAAEPALRAQLEANQPEEVMYVETTALRAGDAVSGAARFQSGLLYRANVLPGDDRMFVVSFATTVAYEDSRPVFEAILSSIALSQ
jgi:hypothetical protein